MNLGQKLDPPIAAEPQKGKSKTVYPTFSLRDKLQAKILKEHPGLKLGDEGSATIKWRVSGTSDQEFSKSVDFEILELNDMRHSKGDHDSELDEMDDEKE